MLVRPCHTLTLDGARLALDAALARAEQIGGAFNVAVVDSGGWLIAFARMDGAFAFSGGIATDKARTVTGFGGTPTDTLHEAISGELAVREGIVGRAGVAAFAGGIPVVVDGETVGAIGASGGSAEQDKDVASAGAEALVAALSKEQDS